MKPEMAMAIAMITAIVGIVAGWLSAYCLGRASAFRDMRKDLEQSLNGRDGQK